MFGEKSIYGQSELTIDNKGRIFLPAYTYREKGDNLVLIQDKDLYLYEICNNFTYDEIIKNLNMKIQNASNKEEEIYYKKRIYEISKSIIKKLTVDSQGRVNIGNIYGNADNILCIGAYNHVILEPIKKKEIVR